MKILVFSMSWNNLIEVIMRDLRLSSVEIESLTGVSNAVISQIRSGKTKKPTANTIKRLEKGLDIRIDDSDPQNITYKRISQNDFRKEDLKFNDVGKVFSYPVLSEVYAGEPELLNKEHFDEEAYFTYKKNNHRCFSLIVRGKSMETTLNEGDKVLVDMDAPLENGCLVAAKLKNGNQYIKRYFDIHQEFILLKSDNSSFTDRHIHKSDIEACHRVVEVVMRLY